jgi:hypothetical protein
LPWRRLRRKAITAHTETQEDLLEIITHIFAVLIGRPGWDKPCDRADLLFVGPIQADRRRILMKPGGRDGIDPQGMECNSPEHAVEICDKQRIENLSEAVIVQRRSS